MDESRFMTYVEQLIDGIDRGDFATPGNIPDSYTYEHLYALLLSAGVLDGGIDLYRSVYKTVIGHATTCLSRKVEQGERLKVVFMTPFASSWQTESVYRRMKEDDRFDVSVMVVPFYNGTLEARRRQYTETLDFFIQNGYPVIDTYHEEEDTAISWDELGGLPDILFVLNAFVAVFPPALDVFKLPVRCLQIYVPYGMYSVEKSDCAHMDGAMFFHPLMNVVYRIYTDSLGIYEDCAKRMILQGENALFSGFPKMDYFYENRSFDMEQIRRIWEFPENADAGKMKRVIIAPHHSLMPEELVHYSTFRDNAWFLLYLAKRYRDTVSFIYKPHPVLRKSAVESGMFHSFEAYDAYVREWKELPNVRVVTEDSYLDIFATSDAMITDCVSFTGEYLYADKPMLLLTEDEQTLNGRSEYLLKAHYQAPGTDYAAIDRFLNEVVLGENDTKSAIRKEVFRRELDYVAINGCTAGEMIFRDIVALLE